MQVTLEFGGSDSVVVTCVAHTEAERAILGFLAEGQKSFRVAPRYEYRPSGLERISLHEVREPAPPAT